jgi:hypothetical protein
VVIDYLMILFIFVPFMVLWRRRVFRTLAAERDPPVPAPAASFASSATSAPSAPSASSASSAPSASSASSASPASSASSASPASSSAAEARRCAWAVLRALLLLPTRLVFAPSRASFWEAAAPILHRARYACLVGWAGLLAAQAHYASRIEASSSAPSVFDADHNLSRYVFLKRCAFA